MFKKIISIKNIGKFTNYNATHDVELKKFNLIYSGNGKGKSTLADIFRSLQLNKEEIIHGRKTIGATSEPEVQLSTNSGIISFKNGKWDANYTDISVFDSTFVYENVYSGHEVTHDHKKNLYGVIVGEKGVKLAKTIDRLDSEGRELAATIKIKKIEIETLIPKKVKFENFLKLKENKNAEVQIKALTEKITAQNKSTAINTKDSPKKIDIKNLPESFSTLLGKTIEGVSADIESKIKTHIDKHNPTLTRSWLSQGVKNQKGEDCPYCNQNTTNIEIIDAYRKLFGETYQQLKDDIENIRLKIKVDFVSTHAEIGIAANNSLLDFWAEFIDIDRPEFDIDSYKISLENLKDVATKMALEKANKPLEAMVYGQDFEKAILDYKSQKEKLEVYNTETGALNNSILEKKAVTATGNLVALEGELANLEATVVRWLQNSKDRCAEYDDLLKDKVKLNKEKDTCKEQLEQHTGTVFNKYQKKINYLLTNFDAEFRIHKTQGSFKGGKASSSFQLFINETPFDIGDGDTPLDVNSFKNTVSSGDKSALALAFFLAQLNLDPRQAEKIVVFDDPFSSQDRFRRTYTKQLIVRQCEKSKQVITLSHDFWFLKNLKDSARQINVKSLVIMRTGDTSVIKEWDIDNEAKVPYQRDLDTLQDFLRNGATGATDLLPVAKCIRPHLENWLRFRHTGQLQEGDTLGDMIRKIKIAEPNSIIYPLIEVIHDLEGINDYSQNFHHAAGEEVTEPIEDAELTQFIKRTFRITGNI